MTDSVTPQGATELLQQLLAQQKLLFDEQVRTNDLEEERLKQQAQVLAQKQQKIDLTAAQLALDRQAENRRDKTIDEFIQRVSRQSEANDNIVAKLVTTDDAFGETVQRLIVSIRELTSAAIDIEKAQYALLTQNSEEIREARAASPVRQKRLRVQELLLQHEETLHTLQLQAAAHGSLDVPLKVTRQIESEKAVIDELSEQLERK